MRAGDPCGKGGVPHLRGEAKRDASGRAGDGRREPVREGVAEREDVRGEHDNDLSLERHLAGAVVHRRRHEPLDAAEAGRRTATVLDARSPVAPPSCAPFAPASLPFSLLVFLALVDNRRRSGGTWRSDQAQDVGSRERCSRGAARAGRTSPRGLLEAQSTGRGRRAPRGLNFAHSGTRPPKGSRWVRGYRASVPRQAQDFRGGLAPRPRPRFPRTFRPSPVTLREGGAWTGPCVEVHA